MYFLFLGKAAEASFRNLRNKYGRERRKLKTTIRSGALTKEVNIRLSELFPYLAWLEPHFVDSEGITNLDIETTSKDDDLEEVLEEEQEEYEELAPSMETEDNASVASEVTFALSVIGRETYRKRPRYDYECFFKINNS